MALNFNPNGAAAADSGIFGINCNEEDSAVVILPVPWEATCSYGSGCSNSPSSIIEASKYIELYDQSLGDFYQKGISSREISAELHALSRETSLLAATIISNGGVDNGDLALVSDKDRIDFNCSKMNEYVLREVRSILERQKISGLLGGDHSTVLGSISAHLERYPAMGVLQIDAHSDLRKSFESLKYSHASVMNNVLEQTELRQLVQVGIRGYCEEEHSYIEESDGRVNAIFDSEINNQLSDGKSWKSICDVIVQQLPNEIYLSFDIDGLDPSNCPNTGTPVPGGLSYNQALYLLSRIQNANKRIIGFDLVEVSCGDKGAESYDAVVAAHLLYKLCGYSSITPK